MPREQFPIAFPTDAQQRLERAHKARSMSATERIHAAADLGQMVKELAKAGGRFEAQQRLRKKSEQLWRERIQCLIAAHLHD